MSSPDIRPLAAQMADLICNSGLCGLSLAKALHERFPTAARADVYLGLSLAVALFHADVAVAELELLEAQPQREAA